LQRIGTDKIDIVYMDYVLPIDAQVDSVKEGLQGGYRALAELRAQKVIRAVGLHIEEWALCAEIIPSMELDCLMLAGQYTLLEQASLLTFFPECKKRNISIIAASPYNTDVLVYGHHYHYAAASEDIVKQVEKLKIICDKYQIELPHTAICFPLLNPQVISVVTGARTRDQLLMSANYLKKPIPSSCWQELKARHLIAENAPVAV
jgi:D-threo-aldose 1-dehydrogenase